MSELSDVLTIRAWAAVQLYAAFIAGGCSVDDYTVEENAKEADRVIEAAGVDPDAPLLPVLTREPERGSL